LLQRSHLYHTHKAMGTHFQQFAGWELPCEYAGTRAEYWAALESTVLIDRSHVGRLSVKGRDALDLLNRLSTNKLESLPTGLGTTTVLTTNKGRIVDVLRVLSVDGGLLLLTSPQTRTKVITWLDSYTFAEDIRVEDITNETTMLCIMGLSIWETIKKVIGKDMSDLPLYSSASMNFMGSPLTVIHTNPAGIPGADLLVKGDKASDLWEELLQAGATDRLVPMGEDAFEAIRVQEGVPQYGKELSEDVNPLEAGLRPFISFNKGCYIGQEVVTRLDTYKKIQRRLMALRFQSTEPPKVQSRLTIEGRDVGFITSSTKLPGRDHSAAIGYIRLSHANHDAQVVVKEDGVSVAGIALEPPYLSKI
jgi:folate-binding protein YgfZ